MVSYLQCSHPFCEVEKQEALERGLDTYTVLEEKAKKVPVGSYGILPIFSDSMKYGKWYHAAPSFLNLSIDPEVCNRASMFRSLQENACIVSAINLEKIKAFSHIEIEGHDCANMDNFTSGVVQVEKKISPFAMLKSKK